MVDAVDEPINEPIEEKKVEPEELYIRVMDGKTVLHPVAGWNLRMFFPDVSPDNPPAGFERFTRIPYPELGPFEVFVETVYEKTNYGWQDCHIVRQMTDEEKDAKIKSLIEENPEI